MITAIDVGATKTLVAQFSSDQHPVHEIRFATPTNQEEFLRLLLENMQNLNDISIISAGVPGIVSESGVILGCSNLPWKNFDLKSALIQHFNVPVLIENDADMAALAEVNALPQIPDLGMYLTISTGIGGGVIVDGKLLKAFRRVEPGRILLEQDGQFLTWEQFASGKAFKEHFGKLAKDLTDQKDWQFIAEKLCVGLCAVIPIMQPRVIIFGGSVGQHFDKFEHLLTEKLHKKFPDYISVPKLLKAKHPTEAVLYGCFHFAKNSQ